MISFVVRNTKNYKTEKRKVVKVSHELNAVKTAAYGLWPRIITSVAGIRPEFLTGNHGPCPKCGGTDRWKTLKDFEENGAAICNQCAGAMTDGFEVVRWFTGMPLFETVNAIGNYLGVEEKKKGKAGKSKPKAPSKAEPTRAEPKQKDKQTKSPDADLVWIDPNERLIALWCAKKKPITREALTLAGARFARYRGQHSVIAIPIRDQAGKEVGYSLYNLTGGTLPYRPSKSAPIENLKIKTIGARGNSGWMGVIQPGDGPIWKSEGPSDMLGILSVNPSASVVCNPFGAKETPKQWMVDTLKDRIVYVLHDCDEPGQEGAIEVRGSGDRSRPGWATAIATVAKECKNVVLPYAIERVHGKDARDFLSEQLGSVDATAAYQSLLDLANQAIVIQKKSAAEIEIIESIDNPARLARVNLQRYEARFGGTLKFWKDEWWRYKAGKYTRLGNSEIEAKIHQSIRLEFEAEYRRQIEAKENVDAVRPVNIGLVRNVLAATKERCLLPGSVRQPSWLEDDSQPHWVSVQNGILNLQSICDGKHPEEHLKPHDWRWFSGTQLEYSYDANAKCDRWLQFLDDVMEGDGERIALLQEWAGYLLTPTNYLQRFLAVQGEGGNGKSVYFAAMIAMLGAENVGHVSLENFGGRFELGTLVGKAANICGDVGEIDSVAEGNLKQFTGGDVMQFDRKGISPISCRPTAKLMMSFNNLPKIKDRSQGMWRRMILVPFKVQIRQEQMVRHMDSADFWLESGEVSGILNWAVQGLQRLQKQPDFTYSAAANEAIDNYKRDSNPVLDFFDEFLEVAPNEEIDSMQLYDLYRFWVGKQGGHPLGNRAFGIEIKRKYGDIRNRKWFSGDRKYVYKGIKLTVDDIYGKQIEENLF